MGTLIVQVAARSARSQEITKSSGSPIKVGRGFGNDIVLADPYVAPQQLVFEPGETEWTLRVLDETNEVLLNDKLVGGAGTALNSGDRITIGRTDLEVFTEDHPLEPTRKLPLSSWVGPGRVGPLLALGALAGISIVDGILDYFQFSVDLEWEKYAYASLFLAVTILAWAGAWSIAGRVLRHQPHFWEQLLATMLVYVGLMLIYPLVGYAEFITGNVTTGQVANYLVALGGLIALLKLNLFFATNIRNTSSTAVIVSCLLVGLTFAALRFAEEDFEPDPVYSSIVKPPFAHITADRSIDEFLDAATSTAVK